MNVRSVFNSDAVLTCFPSLLEKTSSPLLANSIYKKYDSASNVADNNNHSALECGLDREI